MLSKTVTKNYFYNFTVEYQAAVISIVNQCLKIKINLLTTAIDTTFSNERFTENKKVNFKQLDITN